MNLGIDQAALTHAAQYLITSAGYRTEICLGVDEADGRELENSSVVSLHSLTVAIQSGGVLWRYLGYMLKIVWEEKNLHQGNAAGSKKTTKRSLRKMKWNWKQLGLLHHKTFDSFFFFFPTFDFPFFEYRPELKPKHGDGPPEMLIRSFSRLVAETAIRYLTYGSLRMECIQYKWSRYNVRPLLKAWKHR